MLQNFFYLITVIHIGSMYVMTDKLITNYNNAIQNYLKKLKDLYRENTIKPNHYLAIYLGKDLLHNHGSLLSICSFNTEHYNYILQNKNTNQKFGKTCHYCLKE